jgi:hypothetical protein
MANRLTFAITISFLVLAASLAACGGAPDRSNDALPLSADVPTAAASLPEATTLPTTAPTATPLAAVPAEPLPTETPILNAEDTTPVPESPLEPGGDAILTFKIAGGIIGFCDELVINQFGQYTLFDCNQADPIVGTLDQPDLDSLQTWQENLADFHRTFEDNPGGADNLVTDLVFNGQGELEADDLEQQVIVDWVNGLILRLRFQPTEEPPTPEPIVTGPEGICPDVNRPALLTISSDNPGILVLIDSDSQATCEIGLDQLPFGRIATAAGSIYFPVFDDDSQSVTVWKLSPDGEQAPLDFTTVAMAEPMPFDFLLAGDGSKIAWAWTEIDFESDPPLYRNSLRVANIDGANELVILERVENSELRFVAPVRFAVDGQPFFYYAMQPDIGGPIFAGRYDTLYRVAILDGTTQLLYGCPTDENPVCIGGISPDGNVLTIVEPHNGAIQVLDQAGSLLNTMLLPATDYVERTAFSPNGNMAFISATLLQTDQEGPTLPNPGYISFIVPPYTGQPQTLFSDNTVATLRGWLDENRLIFGSIDQDGNSSTAIVTTDGQVSDLSLNVAVGILR